MKFQPSISSQWPKKTFLNSVRPDPFVQYHNPSDNPLQSLEIPASTRFRHVYIAGATKQWVKTLMEHMIAQDMENGEGVTLFNQKGDLADLVVNRVPPSRMDKSIFIDIKDPVPINLMSWEGEEERATLMADINQTFMRFSAMAAGTSGVRFCMANLYACFSLQGLFP